MNPTARVLITCNTEYHFRDRVCVAVKDLRSGAERPDHPAVGGTLLGALRRTAKGGLVLTHEPAIGDRLYISTDVWTSPLCRIGNEETRPPSAFTASSAPADN
jgi:hypothetical protein